jgi:cyclin-dependent kinase
VALKKTRLEMDEEGIPPTALREISLLRLLSSSMYVVRLLAVEQATKGGEAGGKAMLYLVFEFLDTDLKKFVDGFRKGPSPRPLPTEVVKVSFFFTYRSCPSVTETSFSIVLT